MANSSFKTRYKAQERHRSPLAMVLYLAKLAAAVIVAVAAAAPTVALADQNQPDSTPTISGGQLGIRVYRNLLETGDRGYLVYANVPYASTPTTPFHQAFMWQLIDLDGVTVLGQTTGYSYNDSGYGYNAFWMYFDAADGLTWGAAYTLRLVENPAIFVTPTYFDYTVTSGAYSSASSQADEQDELEVRILTISDDLFIQWALGSSTKLTSEGESGTTLSEPGETFWRGAIYGAQGLAPGVFAFGTLAITTANHTGATTYATNLGTQYSGSWIDTAKQGGEDFFSLDYDLLSVILVLGLCVGVMFLEQGVSGNIWFGVMDAAFVAVMMARNGLYDVVFMALVAAVLWIYVSMRVWGIVR